MKVPKRPPQVTFNNTNSPTYNITTPPNQSPVAPPTSQDVTKLQAERPAPPAQGISQAQPT